MNPLKRRPTDPNYEHDYRPGDIVRVTKGPFRGKLGQVTAYGYRNVEVAWPVGSTPVAERMWFWPRNIRRTCGEGCAECCWKCCPRR